MRLALLSLFFIFSNSQAYLTGTEVGNGGDAIVCPGQSPELLDLYEGRVLYKFNNGLICHSREACEKKILSRLTKVDSYLHSTMAEGFAAFDREVQLIPNANFSDIKDSYHIATPKTCDLIQLAIRRRVNSKNSFNIDLSVFSKMNVLNQTALKLHEVLYAKYVKFSSRPSSQLNSIGVRYLTGLLFSQEFEKMTREELKNTFTNLQIVGTQFFNDIPTGSLCGVSTFNKYNGWASPVTCLGNDPAKICPDGFRQVSGVFNGINDVYSCALAKPRRKQQGMLCGIDAVNLSNGTHFAISCRGHRPSISCPKGYSKHLTIINGGHDTLHTCVAQQAIGIQQGIMCGMTNNNSKTGGSVLSLCSNTKPCPSGFVRKVIYTNGGVDIASTCVLLAN